MKEVAINFPQIPVIELAGLKINVKINSLTIDSIEGYELIPVNNPSENAYAEKNADLMVSVPTFTVTEYDETVNAHQVAYFKKI